MTTNTETSAGGTFAGVVTIIGIAILLVIGLQIVVWLLGVVLSLVEFVGSLAIVGLGVYLLYRFLFAED